MSDDDAYAAGVAEIKALRERLRRLEEMAATAAAQPSPADTPDFGDAIRQLRETGTASGLTIDRLRAAVTGPRPTTPAPDREALAAAARVVTEGLRGSDSIEAAYQKMQEADHRRTVIEEAAPGALGYVDPLAPSTAKAIAKLDRILKGR
jgi:hypothetical protein